MAIGDRKNNPAYEGYTPYKVTTEVLNNGLRGVAMDVAVTDSPLVPVGANTADSSLGSAVSLIAPAGSTKLLIQAFTQNVRFRIDGAEPTASVGFQLKAGDPPVMIPVVPGQVVKLIEEVPSATVNYQYGS